MPLHDLYDGWTSAFEGDRILASRIVPAGALLTRAILSVEPLIQDEIIDLVSGDPSRTYGTTTNPGTGFIEVDFHKRRTLAAAAGTNVTGAGMQVDIGGIYVELNDRGAIKSPTDTNFFTVQNDGLLPTLTTTKFKLINANAAPTLTTVTVHSAPANVNARIGKSAAFWTHTGDLTTLDSSGDFSGLLQAYLAKATAEYGYYLIPFIIHSDLIARLRVRLEVDYVGTTAVVPGNLRETLIPYDYSTLPKNGGPGLSVTLPTDAIVVANQTTGRVNGAFDQTRIVEGYGPTGEISPTGQAAVSTSIAQAQIIAFGSDVAATAVDLLLVPTSVDAGLALDLRADLDGKPDGSSLLGEAVKFTVRGSAAPGPTWTSVRLASEFHFSKNGKYWLVLQSLAGGVGWSVMHAPDTPPVTSTLQQSSDGALSWRSTSVSETIKSADAGPLAALYRLRNVPAHFTVPIELQVGSGSKQERVKLDRFAPLGRVDFTLDGNEIPDGLNAYMAKVPGDGCAGEHVINGNFSQWIAVGNAPGKIHAFPKTIAAGPVAVSDDGLRAYAGTLKASVLTIDTATDTMVGEIGLQGGSPLAIAIHPDGTRAYVATATTMNILDTTNRVLLGSFGPSGQVTGQYVATFLAAALNQDGTRLHIVSDQGLHIFDTAALDPAGFSTNPPSFDYPLPLSGTTPAGGLTVSPDGATVYVATNDPHAGSKLIAVDVAAGKVSSQLGIGQNLVAVRVTPDGSMTFVIDSKGHSVWIVANDQNSSPRQVTVPGGEPVAFAIAPDGSRTYVVTAPAPGKSTGYSLVTIDAMRSAVTGAPATLAISSSATTGAPTGAPPASASAAATSPQINAGAISSIVEVASVPLGYRLYVGNGVDQTLKSIPIGDLQPADWTLNGKIERRPTSDVGNVAILDATDPAAIAGASLSQVLPASPGCAYVLRFAAKAVTSDATAEVHWLKDSCGLVRSDQVIVPTDRRRGFQYETRVVAPDGAAQMEIRFLAPSGSTMYVANVSMAGAEESLSNGDFQRGQGSGLPDGWSLSPPIARGSVQIVPGANITITNRGGQDVALVQQIPIDKPVPLELDVVGIAVASAAATAAAAAKTPSYAMRFLKADGTDTGTIVRVPFTATDFSHHAAGVVPPADATQSEFRIELPARTGVEIQRASLTPVALTGVPLAFIAQSPGQLRISDARVAFNRVKAKPHTQPRVNVCRATPPGQTPGEPCDTCYCHQCGAQRAMAGKASASSPAGLPVTLGVCTTCKAPLVRLGGPVIASAPPIVFSTIDLTPSPTINATGPRTRVSASAPPITAVRGIGRARADTLAAAGIASVEQLAAASPADIKGALRRITTTDASVIVEHARSLIESVMVSVLSETPLPTFSDFVVDGEETNTT